jgi:hypothetical protein
MRSTPPLSASTDAFIRKGDSTAAAQATFCIDPAGPLFYGHGILDPPPSQPVGGSLGSATRKKDRVQDPGPPPALAPALPPAVSSKWWWDRVTLDHFLSEPLFPSGEGAH